MELSRWSRLAVALGFLVCLSVPMAALRAQEEGQDDDKDRQVMERFLTLLEKSPKRGTALDRIYGYHVERGTLDTFIKRYEDRTKADAKDGAAWLILGLLEAQRGRDAASVTALRKATETRPDDPLAPYYLAQALVLVGQPDAAAAAFEAAIARNPSRSDTLEIFQALGRVYQRAHRSDQALAVWTRLEKIFPDDQRVQEQIALALAEESQPEQALPRYEVLAKKATDSYRRVQFRMDAAELKVRLGKTDQALIDFESLLGQLNPDSWLYREVRRKIEEVFLRNDDLAGLAAYYERWLKKATDDVDAMARLGRMLAMQGRVAEAKSWFDKAVKLAPSRKELRLALVEQLVQDKKFAEAAAQYEAMAKNDPNNPDLIREWGRLLLKDTSKPEADRKKAAAAVWRRLIEARPEDPAVATQVADLFRQAEMADDAIALYKKAIALAPEQPQYREYLGEYYHAIKRPKDALATWGAMAEGKNRSAKNLGRLAEVLAGFGYKKEALVPIAEACALAKDDFDLGFKYADLLQQLEKFDEALKRLDVAEGLADDAEQKTAVLDARIKDLQGANRLSAETEALQKELESGKNATPERWVRLARYLEADGKLPEATGAVKKAIELDGKSIAAWSTAARIQEAGGNLGGAADAQRRLSDLDRRARTDHLTEVAKLEARLGRKDQALKAGRDLLAAAPGNPDSYQFFADLCFQLGETEEGFSALRRAVRVNPADAKAMIALAETLAEQFRTEESIELYWRAFDKANDLEGKLNIVSRLTSLYLQRNQFDRLVARLEREQREGDKQREMTICMANAYAASGDYGTARQALERLLTANARDTQLLAQLSALAEGEGDIAAAAKFQKQMNEIAPSEEGSNRLAQLYVRAGEATEAEAIWTSLANKDEEPHRILHAVDSLLGHDKIEAVLSITERLVRKDPNNWEALYREGVALMHQENKTEEAAQRFRAILALRAPDDEEGLIAKARKKAPAGGRLASVSTTRRNQFQQTFPLQDRIQNIWQIRLATGLESRANYGYMGQNNAWAPGDFGQARLGALAWLFGIAQKTETQDAYLKASREARNNAKEPRPAWDDYYLQTARQENKEIYEAAKVLARVAPTDPSAQYAYLGALTNRAQAAGMRIVRQQGANQADNVPALPPEELDRVMAAYRTLRQRRPEWLHADVLGNIVMELKRAKRPDQEETFYKEAVTAASTLDGLNSALTLAGQRGDMEMCLALFDKFQRLNGNKPSSQGYWTGSYWVTDPSQSFAQAMSVRADAKAHNDALKLLDAYLESARRRQRETAKKSSRSSSANAAMQNNYYYQVWVGTQQKGIQISFPEPNDYFESGSVLLLREAYELYKRDDLYSDLIAHFRSAAEKATGTDRIYPCLALCYLDWWNEDKDEAMSELTRASDAAPSDTTLRLELAALREQRGERDEALALVDSIEPLDNATMQRRETMGLRLAVLTGNVDRAREAAERLFNLRLDTETQVQLAAQMHQLGMHEMAEAVLGRARRRAGNRTATLVTLMSQYQRQNQMDQAVQVAYQVLRKTPTRTFSPYGNNEEDTSRREAIQTLARSGKLKEMIERAEAQLKTSPQNIQLLQILADYYKAAGDRDKSKAVYERIVKIKPDDAKMRYTIAQQLVEAGDSAGALEHFKVAIKKDPSLFAYRYWEIENVFRQANKFDDLIKIFEETDLKQLGQVWNVSNILQQLLQDEKTRDKGLVLFRKAWKAFPNERQYLMGNLYDENTWRLPEIYDYARQALLPVDTQASNAPWSGLDQILFYQGDGRIAGLVGRLLDAAARQNKLDPLKREVEGILKTTPEWSGGKAMLAVIDARQGKTDDAKKILAELIDNHEKKKDPIPMYAAWVIGQELEGYGPMLELAESLYKLAIKEMELDSNNNFNQQFEYSPARRLVYLYGKAGKKDEARNLALKFTRKRESGNHFNQQYEIAQNIEQLMAVAGQLNELGYPADAVKLFNEVLADREGLEVANGWRGGDDWYSNQAQQGLDQAVKGLKGDTLAPTLKTVLTDDAKPKPGSSALDLILMIQPHELDAALVKSFSAEALQAAAAKPERMAEVQSALAKLRQDHPDDIPVAVAEVLVAFAQDKPDAIDQSVGRLAKLAGASPLEELGPNGRANARQRAEAAKQLGLWLVARASWKRDSTRAAGDRFAERALAAGRRQTDPMWALAMLREWGQIAFDAGDRATAEARWGQMLDIVLENPLAKKKPAPSGDNAPAAVATPCEGPEVQVEADERCTQTELEAGPQAPAAPPPAAPSSSKPVTAATIARVPPTTIDRFEQAAQIARLAAKNKMPELSLRAIRESLVGGPPVKAMDDVKKFGVANVGGGINRNNQDEGAAPTQVEQQLAQLERLWTKMNVPAAGVYEVLREAVLPEARPAETFLYPQPLGSGNVRNPNSVSRFLVRAAVKASRVDDLRKRIDARKSQPMSELPSQVLLGQLALESKDAAGATAALEGLAKRLKSDSLKTTAEQACLVALPALDLPETEKPAVAVLEQAAKNLGSDQNEEPRGTLQLALVRYHFAHKDTAAAKKQIQDYLASMEHSNIRYGGDYSVYRRKMNMQRAALEYLRAGDLADGLEMLGQFADVPTPSNGDPNLSGEIATALRLLAQRPAAERYALLKSWSLPAANRKSIRLFASFLPEDVPPAGFGSFAVLRREGTVAQGAGRLDPRGVASTANMLVDAAREAGKLEELAAEVKKAADEKLENGRPMLALVQIARGDVKAADELVKAVREDLPKKRQDNAGNNQGGNNNGRVRQIEWPDYLIAHACTTDPTLAANTLPMLAQLIEHAHKTQNQAYMTHVHREIGELESAAAGGAMVPPGSDPGLALWVPASVPQSWTHSGGFPGPWWSAHDGHIAHITGSGGDNLYFRYPLTGTFDLSFDAYDGGWAEAQVSYVGLNFEAMFQGMNSVVSTIGGHETIQVPCKSIRRESFNHYTVRVEPGKATCLINGRAYYEDKTPSPISPWFALHVTRERRTVWKNFKLTGSPVIPREVALTDGDRLEGWVANYHGGSMPPFRNTERDPNRYYGRGYRPPSGPEDYDWHAKAGELVGKRVDQPSGPDPLQGWIFYPRPLLDGDTITYEFFYEPGETLVHPTLGHLAFLIDPAGVRLHWITDGENEWTGLTSGTVADEPANRLGDGPLPLKGGDWNAVKLALAGGVATIELNGKPVYQRPMEAGSATQFGLFHFKDQTGARVRKVVLKGDWPQGLTPKQLADLTIRNDGKTGVADKLARHALIGERFFAQGARDVVVRARSLPERDRYEALADWVLPNEDHPTVRLQADYSPSNPAPPVAPPLPAGLTGTRVFQAGELVAPAIDLVAAAKANGQLDALAERVERFQPRRDEDVRSRLALLAMVRQAQGRPKEAVSALEGLLPKLKALSDEVPILERWAELVAGTALVEDDAVRPALLPILDELVTQVQRHSPGDDWEPRVRHARAVAQWLSSPDAKGVRFGTVPKSTQWSPVAHDNIMARGKGYTSLHWALKPGEALHYPGHHSDFLYFNTPLRGNFEVNCDLSAFGWREGRISYGGLYVGFLYTRKELELGHYGRMLPKVTLDKPIEGVGDADWYPYRLVVKDGTYTAYVKGTKVYEQALPAEPDPWLSLYVFVNFTGGARNLRITGDPTVPDRLNLSNFPDLTGWRAEFYEEPISGDNRAWEKRGEELYGHKLEEGRPSDRSGGPGNLADNQQKQKLAQGKQESVLQYHRPMLEDGEIAYEFYYEGGKSHTHPALDRLAFLLDPDGVKIHWMTDGRYDRTGLFSDNETTEPSVRRGPDRLPLKDKAWNRLKLQLVGDKVTLTLNDTVVCERNLEPTNQRNFGLFHFAEESEVRVRNVTYRGDWPKTLPQVQELAAPAPKP
jgi:tetratricopeptide (TPR) repeat protein